MKISKKSILSTRLSEDQVGIWYLGQEGFLFKSNNAFLVVDPYLSDYVDKNCSNVVKWERLYQPPIQPTEIDFVEVVLCTHSHYDHADPNTLSDIAKSNPKTKFVVPAPIIDTISDYGIDCDNIVPALAFEKLVLGEFEIIPIPSAHEELHTDDNDNYLELGYIIQTNNKTYFHAGDMCMYDGLIENLKKFDIDIAFLPINGRDYFRNKADIIGNFNTEEAVLLAKEIGADTLVPMHHDLYLVNCVSTETFVNAINKYDRFRKYHIFAPGELYVSI